MFEPQARGLGVSSRPGKGDESLAAVSGGHWWPDPTENCHLNDKKFPKTWLFFVNAKNCHFLKKKKKIAIGNF